jgi:hypothetical protein
MDYKELVSAENVIRGQVRLAKSQLDLLKKTTADL